MLNFYYYSIRYLDLLDKNEELLSFIESIYEISNSFIADPVAIISVKPNPSHQTAAFARLQEQIKSINGQILNLIRTKRPNDIYDLTNSLITDLNLFDTDYNDENKLIKALKDFPEKHTDAYAERGAQQLFNLTATCSKIVQVFNDLKEKSLFIIQEFDKSDKNAPQDYIKLKIGTNAEIVLIHDFVSILDGIGELYKIISIIHGVDAKKCPVIINHVSTGSWFGEILGTKHVVKSIERLILSFSGFIRDCITGKISREQFENECKKSKAFLELVEKANELKMKNVDVGIFKGINPIMDTLIENATELDINGKEILKMRKTEQLTLIENRTKRQELVDKINLQIEEKRTPTVRKRSQKK